jgi:hypothetical protein
MLKQTYNCAQQELYTIARLGWASCLKYISQFADLKEKYDVQFIEENQKLITDAEDIPDNQARASKGESERIKLIEIADTCTSNWQKIKRYIADAYSPDQQKPNIDAAGQNTTKKPQTTIGKTYKAYYQAG